MARKTGSHSQITGPKIQATALHLFAQHGYAAVSMRQIAREVGVQAGAIYNYVPEKQALLSDLMIGHMEGLLTAFRALPVVDDPRAALEQFVRFHILFHLPRPDEVFISYMELRNLSPKNYDTVIGLRRDYEGILVEILARGAAGGQFSIPNPKVTAFAIIAQLTGVVDWFRPDGPMTTDQLQTDYWQLVAQMVRCVD